MSLYGVSRTVLREALKTLEAKGLVEARAKVGTRVLSRSRWNLFDRQVLTWVHEAGPDLALLNAFIEMRENVELQTAALAAQRRSAEQLRMMHYWVNQRTVCAQMVEPYAWQSSSSTGCSAKPHKTRFCARHHRLSNLALCNRPNRA